MLSKRTVVQRVPLLFQTFSALKLRVRVPVRKIASTVFDPIRLKHHPTTFPVNVCTELSTSTGQDAHFPVSLGTIF